MKRKALQIFFILISIQLYSQNLTDIRTDIENLLKPGLWPVSQGLDAYLSAQGILMNSLRDTDFAISGRGFLVLLDKTNKRLVLTRNGAFSYTAGGYLINHENFYVLSAETDLLTDNFVFIKANDLQTQGVSARIPWFRTLEDFEEYKSNTRQHPFLLIEPINLIRSLIINPEYLEFDDFRICLDSHVISGALELMPATIEQSTDTLLTIVSTLEDYKTRDELFDRLNLQCDYYKYRIQELLGADK
ncbi:MAG: hypothetical protein LBJ31_03340 [Treponema sp.]|jgi:hypothetical protein|nr:hypothetical protein [Treponema sp.]